VPLDLQDRVRLITPQAITARAVIG
jgi:hypothetical protein